MGVLAVRSRVDHTSFKAGDTIGYTIFLFLTVVSQMSLSSEFMIGVTPVWQPGFEMFSKLVWNKNLINLKSLN